MGWESGEEKGSEVVSEGGWESRGTRMSVTRGDWKTYSEKVRVRFRVSRGAKGCYGRDREEWNVVGKTLWVTKVRVLRSLFEWVWEMLMRFESRRVKRC